MNIENQNDYNKQADELESRTAKDRDVYLEAINAFKAKDAKAFNEAKEAYEIYKELNEIAEEIEKCRLRNS